MNCLFLELTTGNLVKQHHRWVRDTVTENNYFYLSNQYIELILAVFVNLQNLIISQINYFFTFFFNYFNFFWNWQIIYGENVASLKPNCVHDLSLLNLSEACEDTPAVTSNMQKVPSMSDLSDDSQGKKSFHLNLKIITFTFTPRKVDEFFVLFVLSSDNSFP